MNFSLPPAAWLFRRYGLLIGESKVTFVSWKKGSFTKLAEFVNDTQGLQDFAAFNKARPGKFNDKPIHVCVSLVGEDYRFEKVAHLVGKYRTDMLKRKFQQLFRGTTYQLAIHQGREAVGRRQDFFLFCGVLSNEKVQPWIRDLTRIGFNIAGVHLSSMMSSGVLKHVAKDVSGLHVVSVFVEDGNIRHNFFIDGNLRFSRLSRITDDSQPELIFRSVRSEMEKTVQYLTSIKLVQPGGKVHIHLLCADDILDSVRDYITRNQSDRFEMDCFSAREASMALGVKRPVEEYGRDSTPLLQEMFRGLHFIQLAPLEQIRYYLARMSAVAVGLAVVAWGATNLFGIGANAMDSYSTYTTQNQELSREIQQLKDNYQNQVEGFGVPPSSPVNMRSAVNVLDSAVSESNNGPGKMLLFLSKLLADNPSIQVSDLDWYISNNKESDSGLFSFANGKKIYEVVEMSGELDPNYNPERAFGQYQAFVAAISGRADMEVVERVSPSLVEAGGELQLEIDTDTNIRGTLNDYSNNGYSILISWEPDFNYEDQGSDS